MRISEQIFPRAVVLICSTDGKRDNVMTVSFATPISHEPKYVAVAISPKKYTFGNLNRVKEFTLNVLSQEMLKEAKICGSYSGRDKDKFNLAKLEKEKSKFVRPSMIKNCPISFECKIEEMKEFGDHYLIVGKVLNEVIRKINFKPLLHKSDEIFPKII